jgi:uncharacterized membrane protein
MNGHKQCVFASCLSVLSIKMDLMPKILDFMPCGFSNPGILLLFIVETKKIHE